MLHLALPACRPCGAGKRRAASFLPAVAAKSWSTAYVAEVDVARSEDRHWPGWRQMPHVHRHCTGHATYRVPRRSVTRGRPLRDGSVYGRTHRRPCGIRSGCLARRDLTPTAAFHEVDGRYGTTDEGTKHTTCPHPSSSLAGRRYRRNLPSGWSHRPVEEYPAFVGYLVALHVASHRSPLPPALPHAVTAARRPILPSP